MWQYLVCKQAEH